MKESNLLLCIVCTLICSMTASAVRGVTVTLTYDDPCTTMGSLIDGDGDQVSRPASGRGGTLSKPYISTTFPAPVRYPHPRRAIAEFALEPLRHVSNEPNAVVSATLRFYFDDVIFPGDSASPWTTQDFLVEAYSETANGSIDGADANDADPTIGGEGTDDWAGTILQSWRFQAGDVDGLIPGNSVAGTFGPDEPFPAQFGDDELHVYGMIGFEVDVTEIVGAAFADPNLSHLGFRWISKTEGGFWTSMDPKGYLPDLTVEMQAQGPMVFALQSSDAGPVSGDHSGRPYHLFDDSDDEAIYLTARDWQGGHFPNEPVIWPTSDGIVNWDVFTDPNRSLDQPEAVTYDDKGNPLYVYWNPQTEDYELITDENSAPLDLVKAYYNEWSENLPLSIGNNGVPAGGAADRQHALLAEFDLMRPGRYGLDPNDLVSAHVELTIDRIVDMSLSGNNMVLIPSVLYVNAFAGDGVLGRFENAQEDFERIDHENADAIVWLTMDGTPDGDPITDFSLSWYKLVEPGLGEPFTLTIDVTDALRRLLQDGASFAGFAFSCSPDGEYSLASVDLVDNTNGRSYLPTLVLVTDFQ